MSHFSLPLLALLALPPLVLSPSPAIPQPSRGPSPPPSLAPCPPISTAREEESAHRIALSNLCDGFVNFVADGDSSMRVKLGAQQHHMDLLERVGAPTDLSTLILIQGERTIALYM